MFHFPRTSTTHRPSLSLLGLLLFALTLRALVPVGYMPDAQALREGRLALAFCAAAGGLPLAPRVPMSMGGMHAGMDHADMTDTAGAGAMASMAHGHPDHGPGHSGSAAGQECPFGLIAHQALDSSAVTLAVAALPATRRAPPPPAADSPAPPMPAAGPPLGPRAPPHGLG
ncbi:hypothetical protein [Bordetella genomosp. 13]|uniref:hypothetical protein n=1 Tax=Bordetella genomosp. 13 TaxID=463040 RepID=UPI0011A10060|nr:hypothetical protein [Bordetella genomosp. 13]